MTTKNRTSNIFVDFHTHILPGIDDGAKTVEESIAMLLEERRQAEELFGKSAKCVVVLTPHFKSYAQTIEDFIVKRNNALNELRRAIKESGDPKVNSLLYSVELVLGAEILVHSDLEEVEGLDRLALGNSSYLLFEFSEEYFSHSYIQVIERICFKYKVKPVLAHFGRYASFMQHDDYQALMMLKNIVFQFNARNMAPKSKKGFGKNIVGAPAKLVLKFLRYGVPVVMGSDCHSMGLRVPDCFDGYINAEKFMKKDEYENFLKFSAKIANAMDNNFL
jgi:protein-tyrosine phosphatase